MADQSPLLTPQSSSSPKLSNKNNPNSIDDPLESYLGANTLTQIFQACFISSAWVFDAQQTFISVFTDKEPAWHCTGTNNSSCSPCDNPPSSWAWDSPTHTSIVSEWSLSCTNSELAGLPASSFFMGCLIGGFCLGTLADSILGRKKMLFYSCLIMSLSGLLSAISPNIWIYSLLKFVSGASRSTVGGSALVLSTEIVGKQCRERVSIFGFFLFSLGFLSLPGLAFASRGLSWRYLYVWTSTPSILYSIVVLVWIQESPRWLLVRGRRDEAINCIRKITSSNGNTISSSFSNLANYEVDSDDVSAFVSFQMLWESKWALRRLSAAMMAGFGIGLVYYGMPLNVGNLGSNIYLSVTFNALAELPSYLLTFVFIDRLNRKLSVLLLATLSGVLSITCVFINAPELKMTTEVLSFFNACAAFSILLIYSTELFPTCVRNSAISLIRQASVLGGVFAPILVVQGRKNSLLSFGLFGILIVCCGLFVVCLPETKGRSMCDTMEEEEYKQIAATCDNINP